MNLSVIVPVIDETVSLRKTVEVVLAQNREHISEILIIVCKKTTEAALATCNELASEYQALIHIHFQQRPFLGGAMRDAFEWATGSHVLMMSSDLETDPETAKEMIAVAQKGYDIVTATRWTESGGFHGYNPAKYVANLMFQKIFGLLYHTSLSDLTFGYRLFKTEWVKKIAWEEQRHAFMLETIVKPLRLGARVAEIPTVWRERPEGVSHNQLSNHLAYFRIGLRTLFRKPEDLLARTPTTEAVA
jgi:glycosyltransferase involved in cell wall biosynthesis